MKKPIVSILLITLALSQRAHSFIWDERTQNDAHNYAEEHFRSLMEGTVEQGKKSVKPDLLKLELQLAALKSARVVNIHDEEWRYDVALIGVGVTGFSGYWLTAELAAKVYGAQIFKRHPFTRVFVTTLVVFGGAYKTVLLDRNTGLYMILSEAQLVAMIKSVEDKIHEIKRS